MAESLNQLRVTDSGTNLGLRDPIIYTEPERKIPTINFAIGPYCPVRCEGCYNYFGNTATKGGLVSAGEIADFTDEVINVTPAPEDGNPPLKATVSGGDPLNHPQITSILGELHTRNLTVKLDTVGTGFLKEAPIVFKGKGTGAHVPIDTISPFVDIVNIPLDGASQETVGQFRRGRANLFAETLTVARLLRSAGVTLGMNTVVNTANIDELHKIKNIAEGLGASEWQAFEYDPTGPNPSARKDRLRLQPGQFDEATANMSGVTEKGMKISCKSLDRRMGAYFMIDDSGLAWKPAGETRMVLGHISEDRPKVVEGWKRHIGELAAQGVLA